MDSNDRRLRVRNHSEITRIPVPVPVAGGSGYNTSYGSGTKLAVVTPEPITLGALTISLDDIKGHWADSLMNIAVANGVINGFQDGTIRPDDLVTRGQMSVMIANAEAVTIIARCLK